MVEQKNMPRSSLLPPCADPEAVLQHPLQELLQGRDKRSALLASAQAQWRNGEFTDSARPRILAQQCTQNLQLPAVGTWYNESMKYVIELMCNGEHCEQWEQIRVGASG